MEYAAPARVEWSSFHVCRVRTTERDCRQGDVSDSVIYIERGQILLAVSTHSGQEAICGVLGAGAFGGPAYEEGRTVVRHGDIVVMYSDGVTEPAIDAGTSSASRGCVR